jgi:esterase/lipase
MLRGLLGAKGSRRLATSAAEKRGLLGAKGSRRLATSAAEKRGVSQVDLYRRSPAKTAAYAFTGTIGLGFLGVGLFGCYGAYRINKQRVRYFNDKFVLTPESMRMPYSEVFFKTEDGIELSGWYVKQTINGEDSKRIVLLCAPFQHDKSTLLAISRGLWEAGYSTFMFDFRSHAPQQTIQTIGYLELRDARAALKYLKEELIPEEGKIAALGCSMGGAMALTLTAEQHEHDNEDIIAVATDCAFASFRDVVRGYLYKQISYSTPDLIIDVLLESLILFNYLIYGYDVNEVGPDNKLHLINEPLLVLHSLEDSVVNFNQAAKIMTKTSTEDDQKQLVTVAGDHIGGFFQNQNLYIRRLVSFLDQVYSRYEKDLFKENHDISEQ